MKKQNENLKQNNDMTITSIPHMTQVNLKKKSSIHNSDKYSKTCTDIQDLQMELKKTKSIDEESIQILSKFYKRFQNKITVGNVSRLSRGLSLIDDNNEIYQTLQVPSFLAWLILIVNAISNAVVPCWMTIDIQSEGLTRSAWRFFVMCLLTIPFVLYEHRKNKHTIKQAFDCLINQQHLRIIFIHSINYCIWVLIGVFATKLTARTHSFCFLRLKYFLVFVNKVLGRKEFHQTEMAGSFLVMMGVIMIIWDSISLPVSHQQGIYYLSCSLHSRIFGDILAIGGSIIMFYLQKNSQPMPKTLRFSNLFLTSLSTTLILITLGFFFGGNEFSFHPVYGIFGLFTQQNFVSIFYVGVMLGINLIVANILVQHMFSQLIRNVAGCFEIGITALIYHVFSIQKAYAGVTHLGLAFLIPGMMLIVGGQNHLEKRQFKIDFTIYKHQEIQNEIKSIIENQQRESRLSAKSVDQIDESIFNPNPTQIKSKIQ